MSTYIELILTQYNVIPNLSWHIYVHFIMNVLNYELLILTSYALHTIQWCTTTHTHVDVSLKHVQTKENIFTDKHHYWFVTPWINTTVFHPED